MLNAASAEATRSRVDVGLPKRSRASRFAAIGDMPCATFSSMRRSMCACNSASISRLTALRRNRFVMRRKAPMVSPSGVAQNGANALHQLVKAFLRDIELAASLRSELVIFRAAVGLGHCPFRSDPAALLHAVQRRVKRALFHAQQLTRGALDVEDNAVAVQRSILCESFQDQQIESSLKIALSHVYP